MLISIWEKLTGRYSLPSLQEKLRGAAPERFFAAKKLGELGPNAWEAIPQLALALVEIETYDKNYSGSLAHVAEQALEKVSADWWINKDLASAIPDLVTHLDRQHSMQVRSKTAEVLGRITATSKTVIPHLLRLLADIVMKEDDPELLRPIGPNAFKLSAEHLASIIDGQVAKVRKILEHVDPKWENGKECQVWFSQSDGVAAVTAISKCIADWADQRERIGSGSGAKRVSSVGDEKYYNKNELRLTRMVNFLSIAGPSAAMAVLALARVFKSGWNGYFKNAIALALGEIGPGAAEAVPALTPALFYSPRGAGDPDLSKTVSEVLAKVDPKWNALPGAGPPAIDQFFDCLGNDYLVKLDDCIRKLDLLDRNWPKYPNAQKALSGIKKKLQYKHTMATDARELKSLITRIEAEIGTLGATPKVQLKCPKCSVALSTRQHRVGEGEEAGMHATFGLRQIRLMCPHCKSRMDVTLGAGKEYE